MFDYIHLDKYDPKQVKSYQTKADFRVSTRIWIAIFAVGPLHIEVNSTPHLGILEIH